MKKFKKILNSEVFSEGGVVKKREISLVCSAKSARGIPTARKTKLEVTTFHRKLYEAVRDPFAKNGHCETLANASDWQQI